MIAYHYPRHVEISLRILPVVLVCVLMVITHKVETWLFPVVRNWDLQLVERIDDSYILKGTMNKVRACELIATNVMAVPKNPVYPRVLLYRVRPDEIDGGNAPTGFSQWGPWAMKIPKAFSDLRSQIDYIEVVGTHRCHAFWVQETLYGRVSLERLP